MSDRRRDLITLEGVRLPAGHRWGVEVPRQVDLRLWLDLGEAAFHDRIERTVDYREVHRCLCEAAKRCAQGLAEGLARAVLEGFPQVDEVEVIAQDGERARRARGERDAAQG